MTPEHKALLFALCLLGCAPTTWSTRPVDASSGADSAAVDAAADTSVDAVPDQGDEPDVRTGPSAAVDPGVCVDRFGAAITSTDGRLDGTLVAVVATGSGRRCREDTDHVHLQIRALDQIYDVALNVGAAGAPVHLAERDAAMPGPPWSEGWHTQGIALDYPRAPLVLHTGDFALTPPPGLSSLVLSRLHVGERVSVFALGYSDHTGVHNVHRNGGGHDGALVLRPERTSAHFMAFRFDAQSF